MPSDEGGQTERVSADLLATSVSKAVLAKEVLRLKQVCSSGPGSCHSSGGYLESKDEYAETCKIM